MDWITIVLRILHIGAGVFWVGAAFTFFYFVQPSTLVLPPPGRAAFLGEVVRRRFPDVTVGAGTIAVLAGLLLYWRSTNGLDPALAGSGPGIGFGLGGIAAIVALAIGASVVAPTTKRLVAFAGELAGAGRPPTPEEGQRMQVMQRRLLVAGRTVLVALAFAVLSMAVSRYL